MCYGFVQEEVLPFLSYIKSYILLIADIFFLILGILFISRKRDILLLVSFIFISVLSTLFFNHNSIITYINGFREFIGLLFACPILYYMLTHEGGEFKERFDRQLKILLFIEAFCVTWQFFKYGANDHGGGSMGNGYTGVVSMIIYAVSFYLTSQNWDYSNYWESLKKNIWNIGLLYPTFLNETKISFILIIVYFILLYKPDRSTFIKILYIVPMFVAFIIILGKIYISVTGQNDVAFDSSFFNEYLVGEDLEELMEVGQLYQEGEFDISETDMWSVDIPRFAKLCLMDEVVKDSPGGLWFGAGIGQFKGGSVLSYTQFATDYKWLLFGSTPWLFSLFIQLGILGLLWQIMLIITQIFKGSGATIQSRRMASYIFLFILLIFFYNDSLRFLDECIIFFYTILACRKIELPT